MTDRDDEPFLNRWSRRKSAVREEARPGNDGDDSLPVPDNAPANVPDNVMETVQETGDGDDPAVRDLPDPATLTKDSDYTVFMREGVPKALRRQALKALWRSDPVLANLDGLNDYDEDFRAAHLAVGAVTSSWKVGRGYADPEPEPKPELEAETGAQAEADGAMNTDDGAVSEPTGEPSTTEAGPNPEAAEALTHDDPKNNSKDHDQDNSVTGRATS